MTGGADNVSYSYVVFGNLIIAFLESCVVVAVLNTEFKRTLALMLAANLFSAFVGYTAIDYLIRSFGRTVFSDIPYNLPFVFCVLLGIAFFMS
ncbi:MAG: hypothetical protein K8F91_00120, partial [Candidatus Obscuribacterales bacterium]|nr:hypothetical protein [Candidatus Obscuribacterales bacterium]